MADLDPCAPPPYMEQGSEGEVVKLLIRFLIRYFTTAGIDVSSLRPDGVYGKKTEEFVRLFQEREELSVDGGCGPEMRKRMREYHDFDLDTEAVELAGCITIFIQPNNFRLSWQPGRRPLLVHI